MLTIYQERYDLLKGILRPNEFQNIEEVFEYLSLQEVDWSLCKNHISLLCMSSKGNFDNVVCSLFFIGITFCLFIHLTAELSGIVLN